MAAGRPSIAFNQEIADDFCERLSTSNKSTTTVLKEMNKEGITEVHLTTLFKWLRDEPEFLKQYTRSKEEQADFLAEEMIEIADDSSLDIAFTDDGKAFIDKEHIARSRLRVETRKWIAAKLKPKKYGDKIETTHAGEISHKITQVELVPLSK